MQPVAHLKKETAVSFMTACVAHLLQDPLSECCLTEEPVVGDCCRLTDDFFHLLKLESGLQPRWAQVWLHCNTIASFAC